MVAAYKSEMEEEFYKVYVTDVLRYVATTVGGFVGDKTDIPRYYEKLHPAPVERRTRDEIVRGISAKLKKAGGSE